MTDEQFKQIQATFPWTTHVFPTGVGGLVQMVDRNGQEVPLFTMTDILQMLTRKLEPKEPPSA
jgi:hypothetical protein